MTGRTYRRRFLLLGGVCLLLLLGSMLVGRYGLSAGKLLHMLWTRLTGGAADWSVSDEKVVFAIRLPRIAAAALVGAALAVSGTAYQGMFRNPIRFYILISERNNSTFILIEQDIILINKVRR